MYESFFVEVFVLRVYTALRPFAPENMTLSTVAMFINIVGDTHLCVYQWKRMRDSPRQLMLIEVQNIPSCMFLSELKQLVAAHVQYKNFFAIPRMDKYN